jgi:hypothetical protein
MKIFNEEVTLLSLYSFSFKHVRRGKGLGSAVATAAYVSRDRLLHNGRYYDFTNKKDVIHSEILLPKDAPSEYYIRQTLWNAAEDSENRKDSRVAREIICALQREFSNATNINLVRKFIIDSFVSEGIGVDYSIHRGNNIFNLSESEHDDLTPHNPHVHILLTTRTIGIDGFSKIKNRDWNKRDYIISIRKEWEVHQNLVFKRKGLTQRISCESYKKLGLKKEPTHHLGYSNANMERIGIKTDIGEINRAIKIRNKVREENEFIQKHKRFERGQEILR